jgi:hypothetical protein
LIEGIARKHFRAIFNFEKSKAPLELHQKLIFVFFGVSWEGVFSPFPIMEIPHFVRNDWV